LREPFGSGPAGFFSFEEGFLAITSAFYQELVLSNNVCKTATFHQRLCLQSCGPMAGRTAKVDGSVSVAAPVIPGSLVRLTDKA
jgi:hypothetical protein